MKEKAHSVHACACACTHVCVCIYIHMYVWGRSALENSLRKGGSGGHVRRAGGQHGSRRPCCGGYIPHHTCSQSTANTPLPHTLHNSQTPYKGCTPQTPTTPYSPLTPHITHSTYQTHPTQHPSSAHHTYSMCTPTTPSLRTHTHPIPQLHPRSPQISCTSSSSTPYPHNTWQGGQGMP